MAQYGLNRELVCVTPAWPGRSGTAALFVVVSDPVNPLCRWPLLRGD